MQDDAVAGLAALNEAAAGAPLTIVGIGASAGGLEAFRGFFSQMPANSGMAFVVVLHLPANRHSMLPGILARWTAMTVRAAEDGDKVEANTVYVPPPHWTVELRDGRLRIAAPPPELPREYRPIDVFFDTLASTMREHAVGIVLSGTGSDGALGLKAIRSCGGLTIVQGGIAGMRGGDGPQFGEMPAGAIATGAVDLVSAVNDIPGHLVRLRGLALDDTAGADSTEETEAARLRICGILCNQMGHDFTGYKETTFLRRVNRRMQMLNIATLSGYADHMQQDEDEAILLFRELLIRVTSFFRDAHAFHLIERTVIPRLFQERHADGVVRVWVPGCATGEEAYSLGILLLEHTSNLRGAPRIQVFATDIDESAISTARLGRYPTVLLEGLSQERRQRFFTRSESGYVVNTELREICTFSPHSLVRDPPFSRMDLISCRNLLIYLDAELQSSILPAFHYALVPNGILVLGISESTSRHDDLFEPIDKHARIFQRRNVRSPALNLNAREVNRPLQAARARESAPTSVQPSRGLASPAWGTETLSEGAGAGRQLARRTEAGMRRLLRFTARRFYPEIAQASALARALEDTRSDLQSITEEHATALEELRSSNEELHSVNEELQSTNEELETSKEEIQSVNEELHTVNAQLSEKVEELDAANSDLRNLFDSTQIANIFLDRNLVVRSFTPAVIGIYNLIPNDVGRPLSDIVSTLRYDTLRADVGRVLDTLDALEQRVTNLDGTLHYILRIRPYRAPDSTISGTLVTFLDVTSVIKAEQHQRLLVDELNHRVKNMLTVVISLASQTARRSAGLAEFQESFMGRVRALAASYALLSRESWVSVALREVVEEELRPFASTDYANALIDGVDVQLAPAAALALGMAIHELATNAVKYGALSAPGGSIGVRWRIAGTPADPLLVIVWQEAGGPAVVPPARTGFGTLLVQRSLTSELEGEAKLDFRAEGLLATLTAPMSRIAYAAGDAMVA